MPQVNQELFDSVFAASTLTAAINDLPWVPGRIGDMGLFKEQGIHTTELGIERIKNRLALVPDTPRGAVPTLHQRTTRDLVKVRTAHFSSSDTLYADSVQDRREFGAAMLMSLERARNRTLQEMRNNHEASLEHQRLGAIKGLVTDVNGKVIVDLYAAFEVSQPELRFDLDIDTTRVRLKCQEVARMVEGALGGTAYKYIHVFASQGFFEPLTEHPTVIDSFQRFQDGAVLRDDVRRGFQYGNLVFEEYPRIDGEAYIEDGEAHAFPVGVPDMFATNFAPADYMDTVNTEGLPHYARAELGPMGKYVAMEAQSNPISLCTRPQAMVKLKAAHA